MVFSGISSAPAGCTSSDEPAPGPCRAGTVIGFLSYRHSKTPFRQA